MTQPSPGQRSSAGGSGTGARSPKFWGPCVLAGLLLITLGIGLGVARGTSHPRGHAIPLVNIGTLDAGSGSSAGAPSSEASSARASSGRVSVRSSTGDAIPTGSHLELERVGLDAGITEVVTHHGVMDVPLDPRLVGWWTGGAAPGASQGSTVIVGHINYAGVSGALAVLPSTHPGDLVTLAGTHYSHRYRIVAIRSYPKTSGIPADAFSRSGPPRLVLITCGGPFDSATGNYEDNIVAYADPV